MENNLILKKASKYVLDNFVEYKELLKKITSIPAPSNKEGKRAKFIVEFLKVFSVESKIDEAKNVIVEFNVNEKEKVDIYMAHIDTVFSNNKINVIEEDGKIIAPGVGDDTANVTTLLMCIKFIAENNIKLENTVIVFDACEEGLGNLKGVKKIVDTYKDRINKVIAFDLQYTKIINGAVGSRRYRINAKTRGGHSYLDFGNRNAIEVLSKLIVDLYKVDTFNFEAKTTYNVGKIEGGTSINTIAESAEMLYEFRSEGKEALEYMEKKLYKIIEKNNTKDVEISVSKIGERPATGNIDKLKMKKLTSYCKQVVEKYTYKHPKIISASTDCNIPLSLGIPAICVGTYNGKGEHTEEEYVDINSLKAGFLIAIDLILTEKLT